MKIFFLFVLGFYPLFFNISGRYERHLQQCGGLKGSDYKWALEIKEGNIYNFMITSRTNEYLSKPNITFISGVLEMNNDTLTLFQGSRTGKELLFIKEGNRLIFIPNKSTFRGSNVLYLDYLEKNDH